MQFFFAAVALVLGAAVLFYTFTEPGNQLLLAILGGGLIGIGIAAGFTAS